MSTVYCGVNDCSDTHWAKGFCKKHYERIRLYGRTEYHKKPLYDADGNLVVSVFRRYKSTYNTWRSMKERCNNPANNHYKSYGARGIKVCERWNEFLYFLEDMGERPKGLTLDRVDNDKGYSPDNCRWADAFVQAANKSDTVMVHINGEGMLLDHYLKKYGVATSSFYKLYYMTKDYQETAEYILANRHKKRYIVNYKKD